MVSTFILSILSYFEFISVKYKLKAIKREHCKCVFLSGIPLQLPQCLPLQEDQICIHLARKAENGRRMVGVNYEKDRSHYYNLILYKSASFIFRQLCSLNTLQILMSTSLRIFDLLCSKLESTKCFEDRYLHHISVCIWSC